ncbi:unnamed protein product, partial [Didymodactylos carnosus]
QKFRLEIEPVFEELKAHSSLIGANFHCACYSKYRLRKLRLERKQQQQRQQTEQSFDNELGSAEDDYPEMDHNVGEINQRNPIVTAATMTNTDINVVAQNVLQPLFTSNTRRAQITMDIWHLVIKI